MEEMSELYQILLSWIMAFFLFELSAVLNFLHRLIVLMTEKLKMDLQWKFDCV